MNDYLGKTYGILKIIGDTGKRREQDGSKILLARNEESGEIVESSAKHFRHGAYTGYIGSSQHRLDSGERIKSSREKMNLNEELIRTIKSKISQYKRSKGYYFDRGKGKFIARITINGKNKSLGSFSTEDEAKAARKKAVDEQIKILKNQLEKDDL